MAKVFNLDFSAVPSQEPLAEGSYNVTLVSVEEKTSQKGAPMILATFETMDEPKTKIWENYVIQDNCLWKLKELLEAAGVEIGEDGSIDIDFEDLVGTTYIAKVVQDTYQDRIVNRVKKISAA